MPELRRFDVQKTIVKAAAVFLVVMAIGAVLLIAVSRGSEADSADISSDDAPAAPSSSPSAKVSGGHSSHVGGASNDGSSAGPVVTQPDSDKPVSSEDPPAPTRPAPSPPDDGIDSFEDCAAAGYPIAESYPEQCFTPDGRSFTRPIP